MRWPRSMILPAVSLKPCLPYPFVVKVLLLEVHMRLELVHIFPPGPGDTKPSPSVQATTVSMCNLSSGTLLQSQLFPRVPVRPGSKIDLLKRIHVPTHLMSKAGKADCTSSSVAELIIIKNTKLICPIFGNGSDL